MRPDGENPAPSGRFFGEIFLLASAAGLGLLFAHAPLWSFYLAPFLAVPAVVHQLRTAGAARQGKIGGPRAGILRRVPTRIVWLVLFAALLTSLALLVAGRDAGDGTDDAQSRPNPPGTHQPAPRRAPQIRGGARGPSELPHGRGGRGGGRQAGEGEEETASVARSQSEAGGGSSPVVPILIAVIVLAAISIGVVLHRRRREAAHRRTRDRLRY